LPSLLFLIRWGRETGGWGASALYYPKLRIPEDLAIDEETKIQAPPLYQYEFIRTGYYLQDIESQRRHIFHSHRIRGVAAPPGFDSALAPIIDGTRRIASCPALQGRSPDLNSHLLQFYYPKFRR